MSETRSPRFAQWVAFLVFSTITLGSVVEVVKDTEQTSVSAARWSVACSAITFVITLLVVAMHMNAVASLLIVGTKVEGVLCLLLAIFWVATVSVVTDSRHGIAVDEYGAVSNGNLYYFSWAGFVCSVTLLVSYLRHVFNVDVAGEIRNRSVRLTSWSALLAASLVVMGSSANFYDTTCGGNQGNSKCNRAVFGIVLGALSTLASVVIVGLKIATSKAPFLAEAACSVLMMVLYAFGLPFITSQSGPGAPLGNLYYFTWASFLASLAIVASCFEDYNAAADGGGASGVDNSGEASGVEFGNNNVPNHIIQEDLEDRV
jgi:hypothetical protein